MPALPAVFQDNRPYRTHWYKLANGKVASYRFTRDNAVARHAELLSSGAVEIEDPFRKGAPFRGYGLADCKPIVQLPTLEA